MAIKRQQLFLGQERVDVSDLRSIESAISNDFDVLGGKMLSGRAPLVLRGFTISTTNTVGTPADSLSLSVAGGVLMHYGAAESGTLFAVDDNVTAEVLAATNTNVEGAFTASSINYIGLDLRRSIDATTTSLKQFLDANTNLEIPRSVPVARTLNYVIIVSSQPFSVSTNILPIAEVETDSSNSVVTITDCRPLMFRLGTGSDNPNPVAAFSWRDTTRKENHSPYDPANAYTDDPFAGGDKEIRSLKEWMDAIMSVLWESKSGEYWYSPTTRDDVKMVFGPNVFIATGDNFIWNSTPDTLEWQGLFIAFGNSTGYYNIIDDGTALLDTDGQCLYVDIQRDTNGATIVPAVGTLTSLGTPELPGSRFIIAWRIDGEMQIRDKAYEVGRTFPIATTTTTGDVRLNEAAATPSTPTVITVGVNNQVHIGQGAYAATGNNDALIVEGSGTGRAIRAVGDTGTAISAVGGGSAGVGGVGVAAEGGASTGAAGGIGGDFLGGGTSAASAGGDGVHATGADHAGAGNGGKGIVALGGTSDNADGGIGGDFTGGLAGPGAGTGGAGIVTVGGEADVGAGNGGNGITATGGVSASGIGGNGVYATGSTGGHGVVGTGSTGGHGVVGIAVDATGYGLQGVGFDNNAGNGSDGASISAGDATGANGNGGVGITVVGGDGAGGVADVGGKAGVFTGGAGTTQGGHGIEATGGAASGGTDGVGVAGTGGGTDGIGVTGNGVGTGAGVSGTGGASIGTGVRGQGGAGGGKGVEGTGGNAGGPGVSGIGGAGNGTGVAGEGNGTGMGGAFYNGTNATGATPQVALEAVNGNFKMSGTTPNSDVAPGANTLTPGLIPKAWVVINHNTLTGANTVIAGQNIHSTIGASGNNITVTLQQAVTSNNVCTVVTGSSPGGTKAFFWTASSGANPITIGAWTATGTPYNLNGTGDAFTIHVVVFGLQ